MWKTDFFFEKKKQKTFVSLSRTFQPACVKKQKFFGSRRAGSAFFSKKNILAFNGSSHMQPRQITIKYLLDGAFFRMACTIWGDREAPPVICVHGLTRQGRDFDALA